MLIEEDELAIAVNQFIYQQERNRVNMFRHVQMHKHFLLELDENYEDISHVAKQLDEHIKMIQTQCEPVSDYQSSILNKVNIKRIVPTNTITRGGTGKSEGFCSIENNFFPMKTNKNKPRSDLRGAKQRSDKLDLHTLVDRTTETFR
jgi:hypothetical protein